MRIKFRNSESLERPLEVDCMLSEKCVYYRRNITTEEVDEVVKFKYEEAVLPNDFRFDILDTEEYKEAIQNKLDEINSKLNMTKLDFFENFCKPVGIDYNTLLRTIEQCGMKAEWDLCNHVYYGVIRPFLKVLPLQKTDDEIIEIFERCTKD